MARRTPDLDKVAHDAPHRWAWGLWIAGVLLCAAVAAAWTQAERAESVQERLREEAGQLTQRLQDRLSRIEYGLRGARGAVMAAGGDAITRRGFEAYMATRDLPHEFPGAFGFGFVRRVGVDQRDDFLAQARAEGPADFQVRELGPNPGEAYVTQYVYPMPANAHAMGLDLASEPLRRAAAEAAAREGRALLSAPLSLKQPGGQPDHGLLFLLPVYRGLDPGAGDRERRWRDTVGWVVAPLVIKELVAELMPASRDIAVTLADGGDPSPLFDARDPTGGATVASLDSGFDAHGRRWTLRLQATQALQAHLPGPTPVGAAAIVALIGAGLGGLVLALRRSRRAMDWIAAPGRSGARAPRGPMDFVRSPLLRRGALIGAVLALISLAVSYHADFNQAMDQSQRQLEAAARGFADNTQAQRAFRRKSVQFLGGSPPLQGLVRARENGGIDPEDASTEDQWRVRLQETFERYIDTSADVFRVSLLLAGPNPRELVRVERNGLGVEAVPPERLTDALDERELGDTRWVAPGMVFVHDMALHRENGAVVLPRRPVARYATPVFDGRGQLFGLVVIHVDLDRAVMQFPSRSPEGAFFVLTNAAGDYLRHPQRDREYGFDTGQRQRWQDEYAAVNPYRAGGPPRWQGPQGLMLVGQAELRGNPNSDVGLLRFLVVMPQEHVAEEARLAAVRQLPLVLLALLVGLALIYLYWVNGSRSDEVRRQRLRLAAIVEQTRDAIIGLDPEGRVTSWNRGAQALFGYSAEEAAGATIESLLVPTDDDGAQVQAQGEDGAGDTPRMERWLRTRSGQRVEVSITLSPILDAGGEPVGTAAIVRDITDERAAQREVVELNTSLEQLVRERTASLSRERERLQNILRGTNAGTWEWNVQTGERLYNARWAEMVGLTLDELNTMGPGAWQQLIHPDDIDRARDMLRRHFLGEIAQYECEVRLRHRNGYWVWILDRGRVNSWTPEGEPLWMYGTHRDITAAKESQQRLAASEALLNRTGRVAGVGGWQYDVVDGTVVWTPQMYAIHEVGIEFALDPATPLSFYEGEAKRELLDALRAARRRAEPFDIELPFRSAKGSELRVRVVGEPVQDFDGKVVQIVGAMQDVTDRHLMQAELMRVNALQHSILENMPCAISAFDADLRLVAWNSEFVRLLELDALFARGVPGFEDIVRFNARRGEYGEIDVEPTIERLLANARSPVPHRFERVRPDGTPLEIRGTPMPGGGFVTTYMDMSERKRAEQSIARTEALLRGAIDSVDEAFVLYDLEDRLLLCNEKYHRLFAHVGDLLQPGTPFETIIRASFERGQVLDTGDDREKWVAQRMAHHRAGNSVFLQRLRSGRVVRMIENRMPDGHIAGFCIDITDLVHATEAAEAASRAKGEFLANMSHEIRTPLHAVIGLSHLLADTPLTVRQQQLLAKSQMASQSLLGIVNDVLDMAKIEAGAFTLEEAPFSPSVLLAELDAVFRQQAEAKRLALTVRAAPDLPARVSGDALRLRQVFTNLLGNALKFTAEGGVEVGLGLVSSGGGTVRLRGEVRDSGEGIAPEVQERLFTPFSQADASTSRRYGGTGLGLSIVRHLVEMMGGRIGVQSAPGQGSLFWFEVNLREAEATPSALAPLTAPSGALEVLVVDDVPAERQALVDMARAFGWRTESCESGEAMLHWIEGRLAAGQPLPDALLVDWQLPGMNGLQSLAALAERHGLLRLPAALMVSASDRERVAREDHLRLADDILTKPVNASVLFNAVNQGVVARHGHSRRVLDAQRHTAPETVQRLAGTRVLVVDDSEINQEIAQHMLEREGASVYLASNGREALALLRDGPHFDVVLMDVQMPEMDGLQATREMRADPNLRQLPVVALTAGALAEERRRALDAGMDRFLTKPIDPDQLLEVVAQALAGLDGAVAPPSAPAPLAAVADHWPEIDGIDGAQAHRRLGGDVALLRRSLRRLFDEFAPLAEEPLPAALAPDARQGLAARVHKLRGAAGLVDALALHRHAGVVENALRDGQPAQSLQAPWRELQASLRRLRLAAGAWLSQAGAAAPGDSAEPPASDEALRRLHELLARHDLDALSLFDTQGAALRRRLGEARASELENHIGALDFAAAAELLQRELAT